MFFIGLGAGFVVGAVVAVLAPKVWASITTEVSSIQNTIAADLKRTGTTSSTGTTGTSS